jgi:PX domain
MTISDTIKINPEVVDFFLHDPSIKSHRKRSFSSFMILSHLLLYVSCKEHSCRLLTEIEGSNGNLEEQRNRSNRSSTGSMSLAVEVAGFGLCQTASPYSILVICVQQETFQAWTVYRRYSSFVSLAEQLQILHPSIPNVPMFNPDNLSMDNLDHCRSAMDNWYVSLTSCNLF